MMFLAHIAWSAGLISLVVGTGFLVWLKKQETGGGFAKLVGYAAVFFSITGLVCTTYYALRYWDDGYFKSPMIMSHDERDMGMMHKMMGSPDMMKNGMMESNAPGTTPAPALPQNHEEHHQ